jgi:hypothetical protein
VGTLALEPQLDAMGAAVATLAAEAVLAVGYLIALRRRNAALSPELAVLPKIVVAAGVGACAALLHAHPIVEAAVGVAGFLLVLFALRAIPPELMNALRRRDP